MSTHPVPEPDALFSPLERDAWSGFLTAFDRLNRLIEADLRVHAGLSHVEFEVLLRLARAQGRRMRIQALADASILTRSGMSRVVDRMAAASLVERQVADDDRRGAYAVITEQGEQVFQAAAQAHVSFVRTAFLGRFTEKELRTMAGFWGRLGETPGQGQV